MVPVGMAIIGDVYEAKKRPSALGTLGAIDTAGWVWGPLYGALLIRYLSWQWQFYLNIPLSIIGIAASWWVLKDLPHPASRPRIDWLGTITLTAGLLALNIALLNSSDIQSVGTLAELTGEDEPSTWPLYVMAVMCFAAFIFIERHLSQSRPPTNFDDPGSHTGTPPLIDLGLFKKRNFSASVIVGGQIKGGKSTIFLVYPQGNFIEITEDTPFFQIGETKYGKPILVRAYDPDLAFEEALKLLLVSFDSTTKSNLSVGLPFDVHVYENDSFHSDRQTRIEATDEIYQAISSQWGEALKSALDQLPNYKF